MDAPPVVLRHSRVSELLSRVAPPVVLRRSRVSEQLLRDAPPEVLRRSRVSELLSRDEGCKHHSKGPKGPPRRVPAHVYSVN